MTTKSKLILWSTSLLLAMASIIVLMKGGNTSSQSTSVTKQTKNDLLTEQTASIQTKQQQLDDIQNTTAPAAQETGPLEQGNFSIASLKRLLFPSDDPAWAWSKVDMDRLQQDMPDNLYWQLAAPTTDAFVLEQREEIKRYWEQEYGQILSNKASEKQIRAYYAHQHKVSTDYVIFATKLLDRHGFDIPEKDYSFQTLARNLHLAKLEEIPKQLARAIELKNAHEARKKEWLADKEAFETNLRIQREEALRALNGS